jgi:Beta-L-arabinofuranosidase, GH127
VAGGGRLALADPPLGSSLADRLRQQLAEIERLLRDAQQPDGYLDSHFQVRFPGERFVQLQWGHELYCAGHLIQAAVALHRTTGDPGLLEVARRTADLIVDRFGTEAGKVDGVCGHPEIKPHWLSSIGRPAPSLTWNELAISSTGVGTGYSAMAGLAGTTGRTTCQSGTPRRSKGMWFVSSTCSPEWPMCT